MGGTWRFTSSPHPAPAGYGAVERMGDRRRPARCGAEAGMPWPGFGRSTSSLEGCGGEMRCQRIEHARHPNPGLRHVARPRTAAGPAADGTRRSAGWRVAQEFRTLTPPSVCSGEHLPISQRLTGRRKVSQCRSEPCRRSRRKSHSRGRGVSRGLTDGATGSARMSHSGQQACREHVRAPAPGGWGRPCRRSARGQAAAGNAPAAAGMAVRPARIAARRSAAAIIARAV